MRQIWKLPVLAGALALVFPGCAITDKAIPGFGSRDQTVRLQIFLDSQNFGPGVVDGSAGEFTEKALVYYREARELPADARPDLSLIQPYTTYTITESDAAAIGTMAVEPAEIAKQKKMPYTSLGELVAERFHTTPAFVQELNRGVALESVGAGQTLVVPNVTRPFFFDRFPANYPAAPASAAGSRRVSINLEQRMLRVFEGDRMLAAFPITPGSAEHPAPAGEWKVAMAVPWPWYRYDEGVLKRGERTETFFNFPPGPNSPVGILWAGLNRPGVGIHGTTSPDTIGRSGSHGCIRLANWDAATFYTLVPKGTPVTIQ